MGTSRRCRCSCLHPSPASEGERTGQPSVLTLTGKRRGVAYAIELRNFQEEIMRIRQQRVLIFGLVIYTVFSAFAHATGGMPAVVGKVVRSTNATVDGNRLLPNGTVLSGDAVTVGEDGLVLLSYSP